MAFPNSVVSHAALPFCVRGAQYTIPLGYLDATGAPTDPTTADVEVSLDGGAFADAAFNEVAVGTSGCIFVTLSGAETNSSLIQVRAQATAAAAKTTLAFITPRILAPVPGLTNMVAFAASPNSITLPATAPGGAPSPWPPPEEGLYNGCIVRTLIAANGGRDNEARVVTRYLGASGILQVSPGWDVIPAAGTIFELLLTEFSLLRYGDLKMWRGFQPNPLIGGRVEANAAVVGDKAGYGIASVAAGAITEATIADGAINAATFADNAIDARVLATDAVGGLELAASAVTKIDNALIASHGAGSWVGGGGGGGDPWLTDLAAGGYTGAQAGAIVHDNLNAAVGTRATQASVDTIDDFLDTEIATIVTNTNRIPAQPAAVGSPMTLTSGERDAVATALLDLANGVETGLTTRGALRLALAALAGKVSGGGTGTEVFRAAVTDAKPRLTAQVDGSGNRTAITADSS